MGRYAIMTDSAANFQPDALKERDIYMLPLTITFGEESFRDRYDISGDELVRRLDQEKPMTAAPILGEAQKIITEIQAQNYDGVLGLSMSCELSSTHDIIKKSLDQLDIPTRIIDTKTVSVPQLQYILHAQELFAAGQTLDQVADYIQAKVDHFDSAYFAYVSSLDYLISGGRLSRMQGIVGKALQIMPIVNLNPQGEIQVLDKLRGKKRTLAKMIAYAEDYIQGYAYRLGFVYGRDPSQVADLKNAAAQLIKGADHIIEDQISTLVMAHSGPDVSALCVYRYDRYEAH